VAFSILSILILLVAPIPTA